MLPGLSFGQALTLTSPQAPTSCGSPYTCCTEFTIAAGANVQIDLTGTSGSSTACFNWTCFTSQIVAGLSFTHTAGTNTVTISNSSGSAKNFTICGNPACMATYELYIAVWHRTNGAGGGTLDLNACGGTPTDPCLPCDLIRAWGDGTVCLTRGQVNVCAATTISFTFNPGLPSCVLNNVDPNTYDYANWQIRYTQDPVTGFITNIAFDSKGVIGFNGLMSCETFCFTLPDCCSADWLNPQHRSCVNHYTTIITGVTSNTCTPPNYACPGQSWSLKPAKGQAMASGSNVQNEQNYPNPLTAATLFNTSIPFQTDAGGVATIRVMDETGKQITTESAELFGAGHHFFYFTGDNLPAGKYFYTIEFPTGVVIVRKSMLIVR